MDKKIVLVTGMSGAGKTSAMNALEDMGYYCIDSFPSELLGEMESLMEQGDPKYDRLAFAVSALEYLKFMNFFDALNRPVQVIFVDAEDDELLLRYRFTRRQHPLITMNMATTLEEAIELERDYFDHLQQNMKNTIHIDTTKITPQALNNQVRRYFTNETNDQFGVTFQSFGFKNGIPMDADVVVDVRFLPNPFYEAALRNKTGNQKEVYDYVMGKEETQEFIRRLKEYIDFVLDSYRTQQKNHTIIAIGCTGGQHRSVSIANWLYETYKDKYRCWRSHRDIQEEAADDESQDETSNRGGFR
ncbi:RNase adapter RapZ [Ileibacterium valens]|uniref:RNase adapter RapZ n=1 Tax=Ileibacterium valens TaxID=1862668 RepID=UPI002572CBAC|nr:RNase adapter RapZ [Ileibacterium valens]